MSRNSFSFAVTIMIGSALALTGITAIVAPNFASAMFGVAASDNSARVYLYTTGMRDIAIGCWLIALSVMGAGRRILGVSLIVFALIAIGDAIILWMSAAQPRAAALGLHLSAAVVFLALGFWFRLGR